MLREKTKIEIVTPVHNRRDITLQCLKSLSRINRDNLEVHIIVVDDGSTDGTKEAIKKEFPEVEVLIGDGTLWYSEGTNVGVRKALEYNPEYILAINDDSVFDEDFLRNLVETANKHPNSVIGSLLLLWDTPHKLFQVAPVYKVWTGGWRHWYHQTIWTVPKNPWNVDIIVGNCVLFPADIFIKYGFLNSKKYPAFGDAEFTPRLKRKGVKLLIDPRARVFCQPNTIPSSIKNLSFSEKINALYVNLTHSHNLRRRLYSNLDGAPSRLHGLVAYCLFFLRFAFNKNVESPKWGNANFEKPLAETFAVSVVND